MPDRPGQGRGRGEARGVVVGSRTGWPGVGGWMRASGEQVPAQPRFTRRGSARHRRRVVGWVKPTVARRADGAMVGWHPPYGLLAGCASAHHGGSGGALKRTLRRPSGEEMASFRAATTGVDGGWTRAGEVEAAT